MNTDIHQSDNLLVIRLKSARLEDIVEKKLLYFLKTEATPSKLLSRLYQPVERSLIETVLNWKEGNQIQTAKSLGINRNTLRKKIQTYKITPVNISSGRLFRMGRGLFLSQIETLDILEVSRFKFYFIKKEVCQGDGLINRFCSPVEKAVFSTAWRYFQFNQIKTAGGLGINRNTLKKKLGFYDICRKPRQIRTGA